MPDQDTSILYINDTTSYAEKKIMTHWLMQLVCNSTNFSINTLGPRQAGLRFADDIFKCIFFMNITVTS